MLELNAIGPWLSHGLAADLLLIIPPAAPLSPYSKLTPAHCGKTPGIPTPDGWTGFPGWPKHQTTRAEIDGWLKVLDGAPYNVGLNARNIHAIAVDTKDRDFARAVFRALWEQDPEPLMTFGLRVGRAPGFLVPFKPGQPRRKQRLLFEKDDGTKAAVEMLGVGQQYVIGGRHPCGADYLWHRITGPTDFDALIETLPAANWGATN